MIDFMKSRCCVGSPPARLGFKQKCETVRPGLQVLDPDLKKAPITTDRLYWCIGVDGEMLPIRDGMVFA